MKKSLAKCLARNNGGNIEKAKEILEQRRRDVQIHSFEYVFNKYKEVNCNER